MLEFCIAVSLAHFGCQANCCSDTQVKSSVGMNITSAIMALTGIMLYISELIISTDPSYNTVITDAAERLQSVGYGLSSVLLMFSMLEFCITVSLAHFSCQANCCSDTQPTMVFVPHQVGGGEVAAEPNLTPPPTYDNAIQIMIGLIHIGFGAISLCLFSPYYLTLSGVGGYPFWGGIFFISSGSVCVSAAIRPNRALVKSSVGLNITSAIMALTGITLYLCELIFSNNIWGYYTQYYTDNLIDAAERLQSVGSGLSSVLLLFSLLEFCIAVSLAHFGCQATCCSDAQVTI
ncbi:Membrane-spanning 4-domains subfamily A member 8A, partial [Ophiophagus hannah]